MDCSQSSAANLPVDPYPDKLEPDFYMMFYHPYHNGINPNHNFDSQTLVYLKSSNLWGETRKKNFYSRVLIWLGQVLDAIDSPVVIAVAPGHEENHNPGGFMHEIVGGFSYTKCAGKIPLYRTTTVLKSTQTLGLRSKATHKGTISINVQPPNFLQDKVVVILDDIWTSGSTLCACKDVVKIFSPKAIVLCAIGKIV